MLSLLSGRVSSQSLFNLFQHSEAIIVPFENNGFHELIIMDHSELEILYVVSLELASGLNYVLLYSIHFVTHCQWNKITCSVPGTVLNARDIKIKNKLFTELTFF